jgi:hypothetical protein
MFGDIDEFIGVDMRPLGGIVWLLSGVARPFGGTTGVLTGVFGGAVGDSLVGGG